MCYHFIGAALYYLAEVIEEYTVITKKVINGMLIVSLIKLLFFLMFFL